MMDASQIAAAARATAESIREAARVVAMIQPRTDLSTAAMTAVAWDRFAFEIELIDRTS